MNAPLNPASAAPGGPAATAFRWRAACAVALFLVWNAFSSELLGPALSATPLAELRWGRSYAVLASDIAVAIAAAWAVCKVGPGTLFAATGLRAPFGLPLLWILAVMSPYAVAAAVQGVTPHPAEDLVRLGVAGPFAEELVFRGFVLGLLVALAGMSWWRAALGSSAVFALAHFGDGSSVAEIAGVLAVTGIGGLLFSWLWVRWNGNLWPPVLLHAGLNSGFLLLDLGETAVSDALGNTLRLLSVALALTLTEVRRARRG